MRRILVLVLLAAACGDDAPRQESDVLAMWRAADLDVAKHEPLDAHALGEARCVRGAVSGIESTVCTYASEDAARAAREPGLQLVGETTGAALARGRVLLVVADRAKLDKDGKKIDAITKAFLGR
jgi:hypothetical protein